jgi:hypothetical protein
MNLAKTMDQSYVRLIHSSRVTNTTRAVLLKRLDLAPTEYVPQSFSVIDFSTLRLVLGRLIPQKNDIDFIDLAATMDSRRAAGVGDGWRYATMPPDAIAGSLGLQLLQSTAMQLYGVEFASLDRPKQDNLLRQILEGGLIWQELDGRKWFEDLLAEATEIYVSNPATLAAMGFSGIAFLPHWPEIGLGTAQGWEPAKK